MTSDGRAGAAAASPWRWKPWGHIEVHGSCWPLAVLDQDPDDCAFLADLK